MFCCSKSSIYDPIDTEINGKSKYASQRSSMSTYPGMKRTSQDQIRTNTKDLDLVQTGGNALMEYDPETMSDLVKVVVPPDCKPGQLIQVVAPDGSGRIANTIVPRHCKPGSTFMMKFLPLNEERDGSGSNNKPVEQHDLALTQENINGVGVASSNQTKQIDLLDDGPHTESTNPLEERLLPPSNENQSSYEKQEQTMMIIVPPGVDAGSTIYAKLPGNDQRFLPVKVPKGGVSQFYVSYVYGHTISESEMLKQHKHSMEEQSNQKQNWHDNPAAYAAPMIAGPSLM